MLVILPRAWGTGRAANRRSDIQDSPARRPELPDRHTCALSGQHTQLVQVTVEVGGIPEDPEGTPLNQIVLAVAAAEHPRLHSEFQAQF